MSDDNGVQSVSQEEFRRRLDDWKQKTYELFLRWQREEGLTDDQCQERFWGKDLLKRWRNL